MYVEKYYIDGCCDHMTCEMKLTIISSWSHDLRNEIYNVIM